MTGIQVLLVAAALFWVGRYLAKLRSTHTSRLLAVLAAVVAMALVLFPEISVRLAHAFGVTRGVDLVIYLALVGFGFLWLHHAHRLRELEGKLVELARAMALAESPARAGAPPPAAPPERRT